MSIQEKFIGESSMKDTPSKKIGLKIKDGIVSTEKLSDGAVTSIKIANGAVGQMQLDSESQTVSVIQQDNTNPVSSDAVYDAVNDRYTKAESDERFAALHGDSRQDFMAKDFDGKSLIVSSNAGEGGYVKAERFQLDDGSIEDGTTSGMTFFVKRDNDSPIPVSLPATNSPKTIAFAENVEQDILQSGIYDISTENSGRTYVSLSTALADIPQDKRKGGMTVKFVQSSDNQYAQYRYMGTATTGTPNPFLDTANWLGVDNKTTAKNLVVLNDTVSRKIGYDTVFPSPNAGWDIYPMEIKTGDVLKLSTQQTGRDCYTVSSLTDSSSEYRLDKVTLGANATFTATQDAVGIMFHGVGAVHVTTEGSIDDNVTTLSKRVFQNNNVLTYNSDKIIIDNDARTISFSGNTIVVDTQGESKQLLTANKSTSFTAEVPTGGFSGTSMAVLVYKSDKTLAVKQYNKLASTDYALVGLKFDGALGTGTTASTITKVSNYTSALPVEISNPIEKMVIIEKRDSLAGLGNNQFAGYKSIGTLTAGQTYYVYVNDFKHTSASSGYLFALAKNGTAISGCITTVGNILPEYYTFVAEEGAEYGYGGRCDADDSINIEFLAVEKASFDVDSAKKINRNSAFAPLLKEVITSYSKNEKLGSILYITDMHSNLASLKEMVRIKSALGLTSILINGGDNVAGWPRTETNQAIIDEYMQIFADNNIYHVVGQHEVGFAPIANPDDLRGRRKTDVYSHQETFNRYFAPLKDGWGLSSLDKCYYYKDFDNVRLITLYHYNRPEIDDPEDSDYYKYQRSLVWYGTEQLQWFADTLGSMSDGQVAVVLCHQPTKAITPLSSSKFQSGAYASAPNSITTDDPITEIINAFKNKTQLVKTYTPTDTSQYLVADGFEESVNVDFSNAEGTMGFMVMGDQHFDAVGKSAGILCLCLTSCGVLTDGAITTDTGYESDYIINAFGIKSDSIEIGRVGQQYFCGTLRDIERLSYIQ